MAWAAQLLGDTVLVHEGGGITASRPTADVVGPPVKYVALYFSAHWCPPCRGFTPLFADLYKQQSPAKKQVEVRDSIEWRPQVPARKGTPQSFPALARSPARLARGDFASRTRRHISRSANLCTAPLPRRQVVFISSDRDAKAWKQYFGEMPWTSLPYEARDRAAALGTKFGGAEWRRQRAAARGTGKQGRLRRAPILSVCMFHSRARDPAYPTPTPPPPQSAGSRP